MTIGSWQSGDRAGAEQSGRANPFPGSAGELRKYQAWMEGKAKRDL